MGVACGPKGEPLFSIVVPFYNEEENLNALYARLCGVLEKISGCAFELFFIDDGSTDGSLDVVRSLASNDARVKYISFSRNFGKEVALSAAIDHIHGAGAIFMDSDLQHPPELIPEMIQGWREGYDDVYARRRMRGGETFFKKLTARLYYRVLARTAGIPIQIDAGDFRLLSARALDVLRRMPEHQRNMKSLYSWIGFKKKAVIVDQAPRLRGQTKFSFFKLLNLALDGITSFTTAPLRLATILGGFSAGAALISFCWYFARSLVWGNPVPGYPSLFCGMLFFGGVQLLGLGIIGEYLGRVFLETKGRPLYIVAESNLPGSEPEGVADRGIIARPPLPREISGHGPQNG